LGILARLREAGARGTDFSLPDLIRPGKRLLPLIEQNEARIEAGQKEHPINL
jgi:hypothetical protein